MRITELKIEKYGRIENLSVKLDKLDVVETPYIEEISCAISELLYSDYLRAFLPQIKTSGDTLISCEIVASGHKICIQITFDDNIPIRKYYIDKNEIENIQDVFPVKNESFEQEMTSLFLNRFEYVNSKNLLSYQDYKNYFAYYKGSIDKTLPSSEFSFLYGEKYFRCLLNNYIRNFKSIWINKDKGIYLRLLNSGEFESYKDYNGKPKKYYLSESEKTIFDFIIFLEIGRFWGEINRIKDLNWESKPLIAVELLEKIDLSFNLIDYIKNLKQNRQIILLKEKK